MTPVAVQFSGYSDEHGLVIAVVLGPQGLAHIAAGKPIAVDLAEQGLPRGKVLVAFGTDPEAVVRAVASGELIPHEPDVDESETRRCPRCAFSTTRPAGDAGLPVYCPNDETLLEVVA